MSQLIAARSWLTVFQLPAYAPELNPVEGIWSSMKRSLANLTKQGLDQLAALVKTRLKRMQYRAGLIEGFLAKTGLDLTPSVCPFTGCRQLVSATLGSGGSQGFPSMAVRMASSAVMPWAAAESR